MASPTAYPWGETARSATESEEATAIAGYLREDRPAPLKEFQLAWVPQHPPPPPAAQPPPRPPRTPRSTLHIGLSYNKKNSENQTTTPLAPITTPLFDDFLISLITAALHFIDPQLLQWIFRILSLSEPNSYPNRTTPISTPEGPTTINAAERGICKRGKNKEC